MKPRRLSPISICVAQYVFRTALVLAFVHLPNASQAGSLVPRGGTAPDLNLKTLEGSAVSLADLRGRTVLLLFGELYNSNSVAAAKDLASVVESTADPAQLAAVMVITQEAPVEELAEAARRGGVTLPVLHDVGRRSFAAYDVMVLPSLVVVDARGEVVMPCAGYPLDFQALVSDSILLAAGSLSSQEFDQRRSPTTAPEVSDAAARAVRLAYLGEELARRGSEDLAIAKFNEALAIDPACLAARVGLGNCLLSRGELAAAEEQFQLVTTTSPDTVEAAVGLIRVQIIRGGSEWAAAEERLRELLRRFPNDPKLVYLAGVVAEKTGDSDAALERYRRAAELSLFGPLTHGELQ